MDSGTVSGVAERETAEEAQLVRAIRVHFDMLCHYSYGYSHYYYWDSASTTGAISGEASEETQTLCAVGVHVPMLYPRDADCWGTR